MTCIVCGFCETATAPNLRWQRYNQKTLKNNTTAENLFRKLANSLIIKVSERGKRFCAELLFSWGVYRRNMGIRRKGFGRHRLTHWLSGSYLVDNSLKKRQKSCRKRPKKTGRGAEKKRFPRSPARAIRLYNPLSRDNSQSFAGVLRTCVLLNLASILRTSARSLVVICPQIGCIDYRDVLKYYRLCWVSKPMGQTGFEKRIFLSQRRRFRPRFWHMPSPIRRSDGS
jgi:hypothetical protein